MPEDFQDTDEEWQALEAPFLEIDPKLNIYALANGLDLLKNQTGRPDRTLEWYRDGMERRASLVAEGGAPPRFAVVAAASRKFGGQRRVARRPVGAPVDAQSLLSDFTDLLEQAMSEADRIGREDVEAEAGSA